MRNAPASFYHFESTFDIESIIEKLVGYEASRHSDALGENLLTTIEDVEKTKRGCKFEVEYDYPHDVPQREGDDLLIKATKTVQTRFCKDIFSDGFIMIGSDSTGAASRLSEAITGDKDSFIQITIDPSIIAKIVGKDSELAKYKIWENIDLFTDMASIKGEIEDSTYSQDFDEHGRPVWVMFDSRQTHHTVGISTGGVVFYGSDIDPIEFERYFFDVIKPELD